MDPKIEVVFADGTSESFVLDKEQMVVGRSVEANIAIPDARELEPQHMLLKPQPDGCWVAIAQGAQTPAIVAGKEFQTGVLPWGTELQIGQMVIVLTGVDAAAKKGNLGPWILGLAVVMILFGMYVWKASQSPIAGLSAPKNYPEIMPAPSPCSVPETAADARGKTALDSALAKSDRYPFDPQDGIQAIRLYSEAYACFKTSGNAALMNRAIREGKTMEARVQDDYRNRRLALDLALENQDIEQAATEINLLYGLVQHTNSEYQRQLQRIATTITLELAKKNKGGSRK